MKQLITLKINREDREVLLEPWQTLLSVLRDNLDLTGAKEPCRIGECGACTVLVDDRPVNACLMLAMDARRKQILTIEGLAPHDNLHPLQKSFHEEGAVQCGMCTPGMILNAKHLLDKNPRPSEKEIREHIDGHICRCTGYQKIIVAIQKAAEKVEQK